MWLHFVLTTLSLLIHLESAVVMLIIMNTFYINVHVILIIMGFSTIILPEWEWNQLQKQFVCCGNVLGRSNLSPVFTAPSGMGCVSLHRFLQKLFFWSHLSCHSNLQNCELLMIAGTESVVLPRSFFLCFLMLHQWHHIKKIFWNLPEILACITEL